MNSIFKKGLLLIAAPLLFQGIVLGVLLWNERQNAEAERWALHTRVVISQAESVLRQLVQEVNRMRGLVITGNRAFTSSTGGAVDSEGEALLRLVSDNPRQRQRIEAFLATAGELQAWISGIEELVRAGRDAEARERVSGLRGEGLLKQAQAQVDAVLAEEQRLDHERVRRLEQVRRSQGWLLLAAALGAAVIAVLLARAFASGISSRLAVATGNARRLAENAPLAAPVGGGDEIAQLDATLHQTALRLSAAAEAERRYKAQLESHAAELALANDDLRLKTQEIETFVYSVSHDLRSPLVNLQGFSRELERSCGDLQRALGKAQLPPDLRGRLDAIDRDMLESVRYILTAVSRSGNIIDALLRLSRAGRVDYQWQRVDVDALVRRVVDAMRSSIHGKGALVTVGGLPPAWGDPVALEQVFGNLLANAVNYLDPARPGRIEVAGERDSSAVTYRVQDNGLGIPEAYQSKLFVAFQRLHGDVAPGEGIGLALVRRVVERHGGKIRAESREGEGTTFFLTLPGPEGGKMAAQRHSADPADPADREAP